MTKTHKIVNSSGERKNLTLEEIIEIFQKVANPYNSLDLNIWDDMAGIFAIIDKISEITKTKEFRDCLTQVYRKDYAILIGILKFAIKHEDFVSSLWSTDELFMNVASYENIDITYLEDILRFKPPTHNPDHETIFRQVCKQGSFQVAIWYLKTFPDHVNLSLCEDPRRRNVLESTLEEEGIDDL